MRHAFCSSRDLSARPGGRSFFNHALQCQGKCANVLLLDHKAQIFAIANLAHLHIPPVKLNRAGSHGSAGWRGIQSPRSPRRRSRSVSGVMPPPGMTWMRSFAACTMRGHHGKSLRYFRGSSGSEDARGSGFNHVLQSRSRIRGHVDGAMKRHRQRVAPAPPDAGFGAHRLAHAHPALPG